MNTVEKTSTGVSPAELILNNSIRLSNRILAPGSANPTSHLALSDTMDNWVLFTHTCCSHHLLVAVTNSYPNIADHSKYIIEDLVSGKRITTHIHNLRPFIYDPIRINPLTVVWHSLRCTMNYA